MTERFRGVPAYLGVRNIEDGSLLAWLQLQEIESTKALEPMVALGVALSPAAAIGPMAFRILRLALGWLHEVAGFDGVLLAASSDDAESIVTAVGARFAFERTETFGDGSTGPCQFYSSLRPGAVRRVQASGARAFDDPERWMRRGRLRPAVVASTLSSQVPVVTDRLLIRPAIRADTSAVAATIDEVVERTNGWTSAMAREQPLAIERGLAPAHRVICELGAGVVGVIATYTLDRLTTVRCQIGFWIGPDGRGKGYGTEALAALVEHLHATGTTVIEASTSYTDEPAQRVIEKAGFTLVGGHAHTLPKTGRRSMVSTTSTCFRHRRNRK